MSSSWAFLLTATFALILSCCNGGSDDDRQVYIVYMGDLPQGDLPASALHINMLQAAAGRRASEALIYSYKRSFNAFAAKLTEQEKQIIANMDGVVTVFPNGKKQLHTTRSWDFIGFPQHVKRSTSESDVVVGMIDSGIWPESKSFNDEGYGPPPAKFKGICTGQNFTCNNKIIGARYYKAAGNFSDKDVPSARDTAGHGTHTASTAAGRLVTQASLFNLAKGTARGGVPSARISVYKVCWSDSCSDVDILAAFDDAIADGVDIISVSIGWKQTLEYFNDAIAIGAFHAMRKGILTSTSANNLGPDLGTVTNVAPWILTAAATTIDRKIISKVQLGDGQIFEGVAINTFNLQNKTYPLVYGGDVPNLEANYNGTASRYCLENSLDKAKVEGKIVLCDQVTTGEAQAAAGALGTIMQDGGFKDSAYPYPLAAAYLGVEDGATISQYINSTREATATIEESIEEKDETAPFVVSFSSRGPNVITRDILKPDLSAPGVEILASWSEGTTITGYSEDNRVVPYNIMSGTSMACPHVTGAAAYIKSFHPTWSPAAIKSALMTTAKPLSPVANPDAEFAYGSGQIDPLKATDPGLIYEAGESDYVSFLCGQGINNTTLRFITGDTSSCSIADMASVWDLNYPSFTVSANQYETVTRVFHRRITNVGSPISTYKASVYTSNSTLLRIEVEPQVLRFEHGGQTLSFAVSVSANIQERIVSGSLIWDDGEHQVRSPIVAHGYP